MPWPSAQNSLLLYSLGEAAGWQGLLEKAKEYFLEADEIYREGFSIEYPYYRQQIFNKYAKLVHFFYMYFFLKFDHELREEVTEKTDTNNEIVYEDLI